MRLPDLLDQNFRKLCGIPPLTVIRALYDLDGGLGATWLALGEDTLVFYHRPSGGEFNRTRFRINEIIECRPSSDGNHACLRFRFANADFDLKCSLFDQPRLENLRRSLVQVAAENPIQAPARLTPASAFCAGIHAVLDADGDVAPIETEWLCRTLPDPVAIEQGSAWYRVHGREEILRELPATLSQPQRECLLVNQLAAIMADGILEPAEADLLEQFRSALDIPADRYDELFSVILARNQIALFAGPENRAALESFATCLAALARCDADKSAAESAQLQRVLNDAELIRAAETKATGMSKEQLLTETHRLTAGQRRTLLANLLSLAMADGEITVPEQEFVDNVAEHLDISADELGTFFDVLLIRHNLGILIS